MRLRSTVSFLVVACALVFLGQVYWIEPVYMDAHIEDLTAREHSRVTTPSSSEYRIADRLAEKSLADSSFKSAQTSLPHISAVEEIESSVPLCSGSDRVVSDRSPPHS